MQHAALRSASYMLFMEQFPHLLPAAATEKWLNLPHNVLRVDATSWMDSRRLTSSSPRYRVIPSSPHGLDAGGIHTIHKHLSLASILSSISTTA